MHVVWCSIRVIYFEETADVQVTLCKNQVLLMPFKKSNLTYAFMNPQSLLYFITYIYMTIIIINLEFAKFTIPCFCVNNCFGRVFSVCNFEWCNVAKVNIKVHCKIFHRLNICSLVVKAVQGFIGSDGTCFLVSYPYFYFVITRWCLIWRIVMPSCALIWVISNCHAGNTKYHLVICGYIRKLKVVVDSEGNRNHLFPGCP